MQEITKKSEKSQLNEETRDSLVLNDLYTQATPRRSRSRSPIDQAPPVSNLKIATTSVSTIQPNQKKTPNRSKISAMNAMTKETSENTRLLKEISSSFHSMNQKFDSLVEESSLLRQEISKMNAAFSLHNENVAKLIEMTCTKLLNK